MMASPELQETLTVLYASQTGNAEWIAKHIYQDAASRGYQVSKCVSLDSHAEVSLTIRTCVKKIVGIDLS
jgi:methionine synthase reductase